MTGSSAFFCNKNCEFFPCHSGVRLERFNCLFCYCPLYFLGDRCGGNYSMLENGIKDCTDCILPHIPEYYPIIVERLQEEIDRQIEH